MDQHPAFSPGETHRPETPRRGSLWPFLVFIGLGLLLALPSPFVSLMMVQGGLAGFSRSFLEGGFAMYAIVLVAFFCVLVLAGLGYPYVVMGKVPSSALLLPAFLPVVLGLAGAWLGMTRVIAALGVVEPGLRVRLAHAGTSEALQPVVLGLLVASSVLMLSGIAAAMLSLAWAGGARRSLMGWIIVGAGGLTVLGVAATTCLSTAAGTLDIPLGLTALAAVVIVGIGSVAVPASWREGTARWLLAVACPAAVLVVWLALRLAASAQSGGIDYDFDFDPEQQAFLLARSQEAMARTDVAGGLLLAVVGLAALASLAAGGREVLAGLARFRVSASLTSLAVVVTVATGAWLDWSLDGFLAELDRGDPTHAVRNNEGFRPATSSALVSSFDSATATIIVNPDRIWVDEEQVVVTVGFSASGAAGQSLRAALERRLGSRASQDADGDARVDVPGVELTDRANGDELGQRHAGEEGVMGRPDAEKRSNRYGFTDSRDDVNLAVHRDVPFSAVREVGIMLRGMGLATARLVVQTEHDYGTIGLAIGPGQCTTMAGADETTALRNSLALTLEITEHGFVIGGSGSVLGPGCGDDAMQGVTTPLRPDALSCTDDDRYPTGADRTSRASGGLGPPPCAFDFTALRECLHRIRGEYPDERRIIVSATPTIDFQTLVLALDAVRADWTGSTVPPVRLSERGFDDVFLFLGDDARRTCAPSAALEPAGLGMPPEGGSGPIGLGSLGTIASESHGVGGSGFGRIAPVIGTGTAEVRGSLSREVIRRSIRRHINEVRFCYEQGLARNPELAGRVSIRFIISPSGAVTSSTVAESTLGDRTVEDCVARAVQRVAFPEPEGGVVVIVTYPFVFNPAEP